MATKRFNSYTPSRRNMTVLDYQEITKKTPEKSLLTKKKKHAGRNSYGRITVRHQGGGNRQKYRIIDFKRNKDINSIPVGTLIHNIELNPGQGGKLVKAAGQSAQLMAKEGKYAHVRLPSGEMRLILANCRATIGVIGNSDHENVKIGKAGRKRHMGIRPTVRGSAMNPCDHPHGGGEGKAPIGHSGPMTPWGKPALGYKTRNKNKQSNKFIVKRRK